MDHDRKVCPRCGEVTAGYGFCPPCRAHIDSLTGGATDAPDLPTAQVLREVVRLEQALADASKGMSDRTGAGASTTALDADPAPVEDVNSGREIAKLPTGADDAPQRPDVARLEDVLTVRPESARPVIAPKTAAGTPPVVKPAPADEAMAAPETTSVPPPEVAPPSVAPPEVAPRSAAPPKAAPRSVAPPPVAPPAPAAPSYVAAHVLRAAFLFEQTAAFESRPDEDDDIPEVDPAMSVAPPVLEAAPASVPPPRPEPLPAPEAETAQRNWMTALCLLALIALVVVLTGRRPCRCDCHKTR